MKRRHLAFAAAVFLASAVLGGLILSPVFLLSKSEGTLLLRKEDVPLIVASQRAQIDALRRSHAALAAELKESKSAHSDLSEQISELGRSVQVLKQHQSQNQNQNQGSSFEKTRPLVPVVIEQDRACTLLEASSGRWVTKNNNKDNNKDNAGLGDPIPHDPNAPPPPKNGLGPRTIRTDLVFQPGCQGFRMPTAQDAPGIKDCFANRSIAVFGDSQGLHFAYKFMDYLGTCRMVKSGSKCDEATSYFNMKPHPTLPGECKRCNGCVSMKFQCGGTSTLEHLALERIEDIQMPCAEFDTTQECIIENYLAKSPPDVILVNAGLHIAGNENMTELATTYKPRLVWYFQKLRARLPGTTIVWVQTSHNLDSDEEPKIQKLNAWSEKVAVQNHIPVISAHDIGAARLDLFTDTVHLLGGGGVYYATLRDLFAGFYCGGLTV